MLRKLVLAAGFLCAGAAAQAAVVGGAVTGGAILVNGSTFQILDVSGGVTVGANGFQSPHLYAFNEQQGVVIAGNYTANLGSDLAPGDLVSSHFVFFDPPDTPHIGQMGYVDFERRVRSVMTGNANIVATHFLGPSVVSYTANRAFGIEGGDRVWLDAAFPNRVFVSWFASNPGDHIRVITDALGSSNNTAVPLPAGLGLLLAGLATLTVARRKR